MNELTIPLTISHNESLVIGWIHSVEGRLRVKMNPHMFLTNETIRENFGNIAYQVIARNDDQLTEIEITSFSLNTNINHE